MALPHAIDSPAGRALSGKLNEQTIVLPPALARAVTEAQEAWHAAGNTRRLWKRDATLWTGRDEDDWLGWLGIVDEELQALAPLQEFAREVAAERFSDVLLLGMGGSSLGPEVIARTLGSATDFPRLHVLDSTDPHQVRRFANQIDCARTLYIVSSKSGTTLETSVLMDYFFAGLAAAKADPGRNFVAITDPGSRLQTTAGERGFRRVFAGVPSIGGRYSVLSKFGLVPLAASGHDARAFLAAAASMAQACGPDVPAAENPGVALGLTIGVLAQHGRDKLTFVASPSVAAFGAWAEQLVAESTGKSGLGVIPIDGEPVGEPAVYGSDRLFVFLRDAANSEPAKDHAVAALERAGHPVVRIDLAPKLLAQEFFRFEIATAVAGAVLGIDPFDQPDVEASKVSARAITETYENTGSLPSEPPLLAANGVTLYADHANAQALRRGGELLTLEGVLKAHLARAKEGDYVALLAYLDAEPATIEALQDMRLAVRDQKRVATCLQFGPRFLHSTGQAYKGGPNSGVFLVLTAEPARDLEIPGRKASFGIIEAAQARGDLRVLAERGRRVLHVHLPGATRRSLAVLTEAVRRALQ